MVNFAKKSGLDWLQMANFGHFAGFSIFSHKMRLRLTQNGQFHPIHNFSHLLPPKGLIFGEISKVFIPGRGYIGKFFEFFIFFESFHTEAAQNDTQWPILPKKWLRLAPNGQFWSFCRFFYLFPKMRLRLPGNGQFHLIHNLSHLLPPKHLIFGEISKIFIPGGGVTLANVLSFSTFLNRFTPKWLKMTHNGEFCQKSGSD